MIEEIEEYIEKHPEDIVRLFMKIREVVFSIEDISVEEKMWAKLPSYYYGEKFVRIIPFKDHINIEAEGLTQHANIIGHGVYDALITVFASALL